VKEISKFRRALPLSSENVMGGKPNIHQYILLIFTYVLFKKADKAPKGMMSL
jgi:hypothetical protein